MQSIIQYIQESKNFELIPNKGIGNISLNSSRDQVNKSLKTKATVFKKTKNSENTTDAFDDIGVHVYYDKNNKVKAIEAFSESRVILDKKYIFKTPAKDVYQKIKKIDPDAKDDDQTTLTSKKLGLSIFSSNGFASENNIDSVLVFRKDY